MSHLPPHVRERLFAQIKGAPAPTRSDARLRSFFYLAFAIVATLSLFFAFGGMRLGGRPGVFVLWSSIGWAAFAFLVTWIGAVRGTSMLGRTTRLLVGITAITAPMIYAWMTGCTMATNQMSAAAAWHTNLACFATTLLFSMGPFVGISLLRKNSDPVHPRALGAALGAASGAWAGVLIDLHCNATHWFHVGFAHVLPIVLFALFGAAWGKRIYGIHYGKTAHK